MIIFSKQHIAKIAESNQYSELPSTSKVGAGPLKIK